MSDKAKKTELVEYRIFFLRIIGAASSFFYVGLCVGLFVKNWQKRDRIAKRQQADCIVISIRCCISRNVGNSKEVSENPRVGSSILSLGTNY